jgi:hypothetical protein
MILDPVSLMTIEFEELGIKFMYLFFFEMSLKLKKTSENKN